jgi:hypothetical protein
MKYKSELYKKEQIELSSKIIDILKLVDNQITLYELDNSPEITTNILSLLPELRKYFAFRNMCGIEKPEQLKRPWLSIVKHVTKITYTITSKEKMITVNKKPIVTRLYIFTKK